MKILIATGNKGKKKELLEFFSKICSDISFLSLSDFPSHAEPKEDGKNFEENALIKAQYFAQKFKIPTLGEDSGLILDAFPQKFGLKTKREISAKTDKEWLDKFLKILKNEKNRKATFYSAIAFFDPQKNISKTFLGTTTGTISQFPEGKIESGIPVSSVFTPETLNKVFSEMSKMQKNQVSHRGKSAQKMEAFLKNLL